MASQALLPDWAHIWYLANLLILTPEVVFILLRPRTLEGGDLSAPFKVLNIYARVDSSFRNPADRTVRAIYFVAVSDVALLAVINALLYAHAAARFDPLLAVLVVFREASVVSKTLVYLFYSWQGIVPKWRVPVTAMNGIWVAVPIALVCSVASLLATAVEGAGTATVL